VQATHFSRHGSAAERLEARLLQSRRQELREQFGLRQGNFCGRPHHVNRGLDGFKILENDLHDAIIDEAADLPEGREPDSQLARYCSVGRSRLSVLAAHAQVTANLPQIEVVRVKRIDPAAPQFRSQLGPIIIPSSGLPVAGSNRLVPSGLARRGSTA
jgi:hypothetical protein